MVTRREVVTGGMLGTLAAGGVAEAGAQSGQDAAALQAGLSAINKTLLDLRASLERTMMPDLSQGLISDVRVALNTHLKSTGRFPEFLEVGTSVFYAVYDWHVKHMQPIQIIRLAENRMAIQFMFTQLVLRWENVDRYIGTPYDR